MARKPRQYTERMVARWQAWARQLKTLIAAVGFAARDPRTPWYARALAIWVIAYALSPLDLIPDPIPILGYLDDLVLLPLGVALVIKLLPPEVWHDAQRQAAEAVRQNRATVWLVTDERTGTDFALKCFVPGAAPVVVTK